MCHRLPPAEGAWLPRTSVQRSRPVPALFSAPSFEMTMNSLRFRQHLTALLQTCLLKPSVNCRAARAALNYTPAQLGSALARAGVGKPGEPLSSCNADMQSSGSVLDARQERSGGAKRQPLLFSVFPFQGGDAGTLSPSPLPLFSLLFMISGCLLKRSSFYVQVAQTTGTLAAVELTHLPAPQLPFLGARSA